MARESEPEDTKLHTGTHRKKSAYETAFCQVRQLARLDELLIGSGSPGSQTRMVSVVTAAA